MILTPPLHPISADRASEILHSCAYIDNAAYHVVLGATTAAVTKNEDAIVIGNDGAGNWIYCYGLTGRAVSYPQGFFPGIGNDDLTEFNSGSDFNTMPADGADPLFFLLTNGGHYSSRVARITVSYGAEAKEYPAIMHNGAYYLSTVTPYIHGDPYNPLSYVRAYDAHGKLLYVTDYSKL
ncbi:hypothetical protein ACFQ9X_24095 [Catenulispora yoronensis]